MKMLAIFMFILGSIAFWSFNPDRGKEREEASSEAVAMNYAIFRNAVFAYALKVKTGGPVFPGNQGLTTLPNGWKNIRDWQGLIQEESDGQMFCYVFGPAEPAEVIAVQKLFNYSKTVGWNDSGVFNRNGDPLVLPAVIPHGSVVSVIRLD